jgi:predicted nucleic acid-binding protein
MTRYVIGPDVALRLAHDKTALREGDQIVAPTLIRSQVLALLYQAVRSNEISRADADRHLDYLRALRMRLLGDRVLQTVAWRIADRLDWPDTFRAEYIALTQLQADAFITLDPGLAEAAREVVTVAPIEDLY